MTNPSFDPFESVHGRTYPRWFATTRIPWFLNSVVYSVCPKTQTLMPLDFEICERISVAKAELQALFACCGVDVPWRDGAWYVTTNTDCFFDCFCFCVLFWLCIDSISLSSQARSASWDPLWSLTDQSRIFLKSCILEQTMSLASSGTLDQSVQPRIVTWDPGMS